MEKKYHIQTSATTLNHFSILNNVSGRVTSYTNTTPIVFLKYNLVTAKNFSWPAVSLKNNF